MHPAAFDLQQLLADCSVIQTRRSGPGGQHRNKVATAVVIKHLPTGIQAEASERRSAAENRRVAIQRLRVNLAIEVRGDFAGQPPSERWQARVQASRFSVACSHADFPALLAEVIDRLAEKEMDYRQVASELLISPSQLVRFLRLEPRSLRLVNEGRLALGLRPLR